MRGLEKGNMITRTSSLPWVISQTFFPEHSSPFAPVVVVPERLARLVHALLQTVLEVSIFLKLAIVLITSKHSEFNTQSLIISLVSLQILPCFCLSGPTFWSAQLKNSFTFSIFAFSTFCKIQYNLKYFVEAGILIKNLPGSI